jgi:peptide deformylase
MLKIITYREPGSEVLFRPTQKIEVFDAELQKLAEKMEEVLLYQDGLGLAAPQVGRPIALCVVRTGKKVDYFCNPKITQCSPEQGKMEEGCLSFPNIFLDVQRPREIEVSYQDIKGAPKKIKATGILARTLQHEIDHLNGVSFIERA